MRYVGKRNLTSTQAAQLMCKGFKVILTDLTSETWDTYHIFVESEKDRKEDLTRLYNVHKRSLPIGIDERVF